MLLFLDVYLVSNRHMPSIFDRGQLEVVEPRSIVALMSLEKLFHLLLMSKIHVVILSF